jgi:enamine deaminase RidA (YjgF/YER057c/UK114 family)
MEEFGMSAHAMCKASHQGIGLATVELNDIGHVFATAIPRCGGTLREQAENALQSLDDVLRAEGTRQSIIRQTVFLTEPSQIDECRQIIRDFYGADLPVTSYVPQPPCGGKLLSIEAIGVGRGKAEVQIERFSDQIVRVTHNALSWVHCANVTPRDGVTGAYNQTISSLAKLRGQLAKLDVGFDHVIRTWFYLGGIVADEGDTQRYKELNRARSSFFEGVQFLAGCQTGLPQPLSPYPASTGIGTEGRGLMLSCIALATARPDIVAMPLENPRQKSAFHYASSYSPKSPKFARALALSCGNYATIFISGTASIVDSESLHLGDVEAQTHQTIDNIEALISEDNLRRHGLPGFGSSLEGLGLVRVYIKRTEDYPKILAVCAQRLGEVPAIYTTADVCRPELLVEIEGMAFSRREPSPSGSILRGPHFRETAPKPKIAARPQ